MLATAAMLALSGCAVVKVGDVYNTGEPYKMVVVPAGHMPPSGMCRIWYPDRHISQQPAPGDCTALRDNIPAGAYLIRT
jgi:hypothetical protein